MARSPLPPPLLFLVGWHSLAPCMASPATRVPPLPGLGRLHCPAQSAHTSPSHHGLEPHGPAENRPPPPIHYPALTYWWGQPVSMVFYLRQSTEIPGTPHATVPNRLSALSSSAHAVAAPKISPQTASLPCPVPSSSLSSLSYNSRQDLFHGCSSMAGDISPPTTSLCTTDLARL